MKSNMNMEIGRVISISSIVVLWLIASSSNTILDHNYYGYSLVLLNPITVVRVDAFIINGGHTSPVPHRQQHHHHQHLDRRWTNRDHNNRPPIMSERNKLRWYAIGSGSSNNKGAVGDTKDVITLSDDPRVYLIPNILTSEECQSYIDRAEQNNSKSKNTNKDGDGNDDRQMQQSNAPQATINISRLWPLPFLCIGAGIPPILRLLSQEQQQQSAITPPPVFPSPSELLSVAIPPIAIAAVVTAALSLVVTQGLQFYAKSGASRTSESLALNSQRDVEFIRPLVEKVTAAVTNFHETATTTTTTQSRAQQSPPPTWKNWEAPVLTRYSPGASFASHNDASPTRGSEWSDLGGQRTVTAITYLNTCTKGGGTQFDRLGFTVMPEGGSALVFYPADGETWEADERTVHCSLEAVEEKFIVQIFGRGGERVPPPLGIPDCYED